MPLLESKIESDFVDWVRELEKPAIALKLVLLSLTGFPDRTILAEAGVVFFIEFKKGKNKQQADQRYWQRILERMGFKYYVCYSKEEAIKAFKKETMVS